MEATTAGNEMNASSYRVKFDKQNFLELVRIAKPKIIYRRRNMHFFAYDGFVMYCDQCENSDFSQIILDAIEFSNYQWSK
jgi:2-phospho-L-lactate guanylyltransferase (CobY/MobA/RfbA family)